MTATRPPWAAPDGMAWIRAERANHTPDGRNRCDSERCFSGRYPCDIAEWLDTAIEFADALAAAQGEIGRLKAALERYAEHDPTCRWRKSQRCSCGLIAALAERAEGQPPMDYCTMCMGYFYTDHDHWALHKAPQRDGQPPRERPEY